MPTGHKLPFDEPVWQLDREIEELQMSVAGDRKRLARDIRKKQRKRDKVLDGIYAKHTPGQQVQVARHPDRPSTLQYTRMLLEDFVEIHGDRRYGDDRAIVTGMGKLDGRSVMLIGHQKGRDTKDKLRCNFGMPHPEGYRKALRAMKLAEKFGLPVVTLVDTPGAYPGIGAEERGEAEAIAENLLEMARLHTPVVSVIMGEGCSGGAIGIGLADRILMLQFAYYAVISPEGCAAILWRTGDKAPEAASAMRLTAQDLQQLGLIEDIIQEPSGGAHRDPEKMAADLKETLTRTLDDLRGHTLDRLLEQRYEKYRRVGVFREDGREVDQARAFQQRRAAEAKRRSPLRGPAARKS